MLSLLAGAILWAAVIGLLGGLFPAIRATRLPAAVALRASPLYTTRHREHQGEPARVETARKTYEQLGAKVKDFYCVMGQYDAVLIAEAPDDETMAKIQLALGSLGNVRSETLRAFTEDEYRRIVAALP